MRQGLAFLVQKISLRSGLNVRADSGIPISGDERFGGIQLSNGREHCAGYIRQLGKQVGWDHAAIAHILFADRDVLIDGKTDDKFKRASTNLPKFKYQAVEGINVFDLLKYDTAVITKESVAQIVDRCSME